MSERAPLPPADAAAALIELHDGAGDVFGDHLRDEVIAAHSDGATVRAAQLSAMWRLWAGRL